MARYLSTQWKNYSLLRGSRTLYTSLKFFTETVPPINLAQLTSAITWFRLVSLFPPRVSKTWNQTTARRYSLMKTMLVSRPGVGFPVHHDECHMRVSSLVGLSSSSSVNGDDWCGLIGLVNDYRHQSRGRHQPNFARLPVHFFDASWQHVLHLALFMIIARALPRNGLMTSGNCQQLSGRTAQCTACGAISTTTMNAILCSELRLWNMERLRERWGK